MAIVATVVVGYTGISMMSKNNNNTDTLTNLNNINLLQNQNQTLNTKYLYYLELDTLKEISTNLDSMSEFTV